MLHCDTDSGLSSSLDGSNCGKVIYQKIEVKMPELNIQKIISVPTEATVGMLKKQFLKSLSTALKDSMNFGLFVPPMDGRAGKFLYDERTLTEYGLHQGNCSVELRYKRRLYKTTNINITRLKRLHSKANLRSFVDHVHGDDIGKVTKMLNKGLDPNYQLKESGETPLTTACGLRRPGSMIKVLVEGGAHLDYRQRSGRTALHVAAILGSLEAVKLLLDLGQSPNTVDSEGLTPLYLCVSNDAGIACAERLLFDHAVIGVEDDNGLQEIHQAARFGHVQQLELLLQYGADIDSHTSKNGNTPLHICAYMNQETCARLLLFRGADRSRENRSGHTALEEALLRDNRCVAMLIEHYKDEDVVPVRCNGKRNEKRRSSAACLLGVHRSRSVNVLPERPYAAETGTRTLGRTAGSRMARAVDGEFVSSLRSKKRFSKSFTNLNQFRSGWMMQWAEVDGSGSVGTTGSRDGEGQWRNGSSHSRHSSKSDLTNISEIDTRYLPRVVVLQTINRDFGFGIRSIKGTFGQCFTPTSQYPSQQYFDQVDPSSVAARAGIFEGDFLLEVNNRSVVYASHEETTHIINMAGDILAMKVISVNRDRDPSANEWKCLPPPPHMSTFTRTPHLTHNNASSVSSSTHSRLGPPPSIHPQSSYFLNPMLPLSDSMKSFGTRTHKMSSAVPSSVARPESTASFDSVYPMPPPPIAEFSPMESTIEEETLRRQSHRVSSLRMSEHYEACPPPPPPCLMPPPPPQCLAPPPPPPPPPPITPQTHRLRSRSIGASERPVHDPPSALDNSLRDAIARRRQQIDNILTQPINDSTKSHTRATLNTLKHANQLARTQSSRCRDNPTEAEPILRTATLQRHHCEAQRKSETVTSRLYLI